LIELIVSLSLAAVLIGGIFGSWSLLQSRSADPLASRQALNVAQSLLREMELQPLPGDAVAGTGPGRTGFASITDYNGLDMTGIVDVEGNAVSGLENYRAQISVQSQALAGVPASHGWWMQVTVTDPAGARTVLASWRSKR
jgi:type II secretory pathway pseudopilin PulG